MELAMLERMRLLMGNDPLPLRKPEQEGISHFDEDFEGPEFRNDNIVRVSDDSSEEDQSKKQTISEYVENTGSKKKKKKKKGKTPLAEAQEPGDEKPATSGPQEANKTFKFDQNVGQLASVDEVFCPITLIAKFPYKYLRKAYMEQASHLFFAGGRFWDRPWDVYYIHPPYFMSPRPLLLVTLSQVEALLEEIQRALKCSVRIPDDAEETGFILKFSDDHTPIPRFLGHSISRYTYDSMAQQVPGPEFKPEGEPADQPVATDRSVEAFREKMALAIAAGKKKNLAAKAKKQAERLEKNLSTQRQLKRVQRYLGLRPKSSTVKNSITTAANANEQLSDSTTSSTYAPIDPKNPAPYPFDAHVVFVSVDIEAYERDHNLITEIGISYLDTLDLVDLAPGDEGKEWIAKIKSRHFRIREHGHIVNSEFVHGCADRFEFGDSEWINIEDAPKVVAECFRLVWEDPPTEADSSNLRSGMIADADFEDDRKRKIILLGHNTTTDIDYLKALGYNPHNLSNLVEVMDTALMYCAFKRESEIRSLGTILYELGLIGWNLHNAGNDAAYTLQAMIGIALRSVESKEKLTREREEGHEKRKEEALKSLHDRLKQETVEWDSAGDDDDGGVPISPTAHEADEGNSTSPKGKKHRREKSMLKTKIEMESSATEAAVSSSVQEDGGSVASTQSGGVKLPESESTEASKAD